MQWTMWFIMAWKRAYVHAALYGNHWNFYRSRWVLSMSNSHAYLSSLICKCIYSAVTHDSIQKEKIYVVCVCPGRPCLPFMLQSLVIVFFGTSLASLVTLLGSFDSSGLWSVMYDFSPMNMYLSQNLSVLERSINGLTRRNKFLMHNFFVDKKKKEGQQWFDVDFYLPSLVDVTLYFSTDWIALWFLGCRRKLTHFSSPIMGIKRKMESLGEFVLRYE